MLIEESMRKLVRELIPCEVARKMIKHYYLERVVARSGEVIALWSIDRDRMGTQMFLMDLMLLKRLVCCVPRFDRTVYRHRKRDINQVWRAILRSIEKLIKSDVSMEEKEGNKGRAYVYYSFRERSIDIIIFIHSTGTCLYNLIGGPFEILEYHQPIATYRGMACLSSGSPVN